MIRPEDGRQIAGVRPALWPVALAVAVRLGIWVFVPGERYASDEAGYVQAGVTLATTGEQDLFWPPLTGWLVAFAHTLWPGASIKVIRLLWIAMDIGCVCAVRVLAWRVASAMFSATPEKAARMATLATLAYALYLPAISHAQFVTSETLSLLQLLLSLVMLTLPAAGIAAFAAAGALTGTLVLTRTSLLPVAAFQIDAAFRKPIGALPRALAFLLVAMTPVGLITAKNAGATGEVTVSRNAAYNLYIGNQPFYAEDLNLFSPRATPEQIEFRRQLFTNQLVYPDLTAQQMQQQATAWIVANPLTFMQRVVGRLARVFVPKTDVLELLGGEASAGIFKLAPLALLVLTNLQWTFVLFGGIFGVAVMWRATPDYGRLWLMTILGCTVLCLVAISKPRYSFVFDPLLLIGAVMVSLEPARAWSYLKTRDRWMLFALAAFLAWGWVAWLIFSLTSRAAL